MQQPVVEMKDKLEQPGLREDVEEYGKELEQLCIVEKFGQLTKLEQLAGRGKLEQLEFGYMLEELHGVGQLNQLGFEGGD